MKFNYLIAFPSWDNKQYVYCIYFSGCDVIKFEFSLSDLSNQAIFLHDEKVKTKIWISREQKEL